MRRMPIRGRDCSLWRPWDVPRPRYAVLDGVSPAYPPATGRLHTCYSPVRRSPATAGKPAAPLPLDLHVLSLSLAFILSQDQTLRCCLSLFLFFYFKKNQDKPKCIVCLFLKQKPEPGVADLLWLWWNLTWESFFMTLVLLPLSIVNLSMYSVSSWTPAPRGLSEKWCKVTNNFWIDQIFINLFWEKFSFIISISLPLRLRWGHFLKASAKVDTFAFPSKLYH